MPFAKNSLFNTTWITVIASFLATTIAATVLFGWVFDYQLLKSFSPGWATMKINTSLGIIFSVFSLLLFVSGKNKGIAFLLACFVFLLGAISLSEYLFRWDAHIDELFFADTRTLFANHPGRMAIAACCGFILLGISLLLYTSEKKILRQVSEWFAILVLMFSLMTFVTYLYRASQFFKAIQLATVSLPTVISGFLISAGILFSRLETGFLSVFHKDTIAAKVGLRGILLAVVLIIILSWLRLKGEEANLFDKAMGFSIMAIIFSLLFFLVTWISTKNLNVADEKFKSLLESAPDAMIIVNEEGKVIIANHQTGVLFGYGKEEIINQPIEIFVPNDSNNKQANYMFNYFKNPSMRSMDEGLELFAVRKNATRFPVEISLSPLKTPEGLLVTATIRDIKERKRAEQQLEESYQAIRKLTEHIQTVREEERKLIAREIHDELGQQLAVLKMDIDWMNKTLFSADTTVRQKFENIIELVGSMVNEVRRISSVLRPSLLDDMGLSAAIEWHLEEFEKRSDISTRFIEPSIEPELTDSVKTGLFRIFQESMNNIASHAGAKEIKVGIKYQDGKVLMSIQDDGNAFIEENIAGQKTLGILSMKERCVMLGGTYEINSIPGKGTVVLVTIPLMEK